MRTSALRFLGAIAYILGSAGAGSFALFVFSKGQEYHLFSPLFLVQPGWLINFFWIVLFTFQHSGMARGAFKRWSGRIIASPLERSFYVACSGVLLLLLPMIWQPLSGPPVWRLSREWVVIPILAMIAQVVITWRYDHLGLFGIRQTWVMPEQPETLIRSGPYRFVRHPLMLCLLLLLWVQPTMSRELLQLAAGMTGYILLGILLEEKDLHQRFGMEYAEYCRKVPRLIPVFRHRKENSHG